MSRYQLIKENRTKSETSESLSCLSASNDHEMRTSQTVTQSKQKTERCDSYFSAGRLIGCREALPGFSECDSGSDERQLTGLSMLMMCSHRAAGKVGETPAPKLLKY